LPDEQHAPPPFTGTPLRIVITSGQDGRPCPVLVTRKRKHAVHRSGLMRSESHFLFVPSPWSIRHAGKQQARVSGVSARGSTNVGSGRSRCCPYRMTGPGRVGHAGSNTMPPVPAHGILRKLIACQNLFVPHRARRPRARDKRPDRDPKRKFRIEPPLMSCPEGQRSRGGGLRDRGATVAFAVVQQAFRWRY